MGQRRRRRSNDRWLWPGSSEYVVPIKDNRWRRDGRSARDPTTLSFWQDRHRGSALGAGSVHWPFPWRRRPAPPSIPLALLLASSGAFSPATAKSVCLDPPPAFSGSVIHIL